MSNDPIADALAKGAEAPSVKSMSPADLVKAVVDAEDRATFLCQSIAGLVAIAVTSRKGMDKLTLDQLRLLAQTYMESVLSRTLSSAVAILGHIKEAYPEEFSHADMRSILMKGISKSVEISLEGINVANSARDTPDAEGPPPWVTAWIERAKVNVSEVLGKVKIDD